MAGTTTNKEVTRVIREVYSDENSTENFEYELESALEAGVHYIVIEPTKIGEETSRWIKVGNGLHKTSVLSGLATLFLPQLLPDSLPFGGYLSIPTGITCIGCATLYGISWQFDPCCKYQVTADSRELSRLNVRNLTNSSPVVLVRKDDKFRKLLHNGLAVLNAFVIAKAFEQYWHSWRWMCGRRCHSTICFIDFENFYSDPSFLLSGYLCRFVLEHWYTFIYLFEDEYILWLMILVIWLWILQSVSLVSLSTGGTGMSSSSDCSVSVGLSHAQQRS